MQKTTIEEYRELYYNTMSERVDKLGINYKVDKHVREAIRHWQVGCRIYPDDANERNIMVWYIKTIGALASHQVDEDGKQFIYVSGWTNWSDNPGDGQ